MGYYIQTSVIKGKAKEIVSVLGGSIVSQSEANLAMKDATKGVICVVDNGPFEAAAFCYSENEFAEFTREDDFRPKQFVVLDRKIAEKESDYKR